MQSIGWDIHCYQQSHSAGKQATQRCFLYWSIWTPTPKWPDEYTTTLSAPENNFGSLTTPPMTSPNWEFLRDWGSFSDGVDCLCRIYSRTWELGTPKGLRKIVLNCKVLLLLRFISVYRIRLGTREAVLNSQVVPICQVVIKTGFTVYLYWSKRLKS